MLKTSDEDAADLVTLADRIVQDSKRLLSQQVELLRAEVSQQLRGLAVAGALLAAGGVLAAVGGLLLGLMLVHLLNDVTGLPLWACYGIFGGTLAAAAAALLWAGWKRLAEVQLLPRQTTEALEENLTWLKEQVKP